MIDKTIIKNHRLPSNDPSYLWLKENLPDCFRKVANDPTHIAHTLFTYKRNQLETKCNERIFYDATLLTSS